LIIAAASVTVLAAILASLLVAGDTPTRAAVLTPVVLPPQYTPLPSATTIGPLPFDGTLPVASPTRWSSWALLDRRTDEVWSSANGDEASRTASMVKAWLAALYLRKYPQPTPAWLGALSTMIRDSNNSVADRVYQVLGGNRAVTDAVRDLCGVEEYVPSGRWWASTTISPRQAVLLGDCIADGRIASPEWTQWLLAEMRQVRGDGNFGIRWAMPESERSQIAIKNGWTSGWGDGWYVNCMAVSDAWVLVIETRSGSLGDGQDGCWSITTQLLRVPPKSA
jgi:hypothetical protein